MSEDLASLTAEAFSPLVGDSFLVRLEESDALEMVLLSVEAGIPQREGQRVPFSLVFKGPSEPLLPQRIYQFQHPGLGLVPIFIVPIGRESEAILYEAVFG